MDSTSKYTWLAAAVLAAVAAAYVYTALIYTGPSTPGYVDPSLLVYAAAIALAAFTVKQAMESRSKAGSQMKGSDTVSSGGGGSSKGHTVAGGSPGSRELVDDSGFRFGVSDDGYGGVEGDDGFRILGSEFDDLLSTSVDYEAEDERRNEARQQVVDDLREAAAYSVSRRMEVDLEDAENRVMSGDWTDEPRAAALLSDETGPELPWRYRLLDMLAGRDVFLSSVDESVEAIASDWGYR